MDKVRHDWRRLILGLYPFIVYQAFAIQTLFLLSFHTTHAWRLER